MSLQDLGPLKDQFSAASSRWPNLRAHLVTWPEDRPIPKDLPGMDLTGHYCLSCGGMDWKAVVTGGMDLDTRKYRYRDGRAGALLLRWDFARFGGDPREVEDPDELIGLEGRFRALVREGARILGEVGADVGLSDRWKGQTRWLLAVFETLSPERRQIGAYAVETVEDVFLASAQVIERWLEIGPEKPPTAHQDETEDSSWVSASKIWRGRFTTYKQFRAFLDGCVEIRRRNPTPQRLEIHAGDWLSYWASQDRQAFDGLDKERPSIAGDFSEDFLEGAADRLARIQQKKRQGK